MPGLTQYVNDRPYVASSFLSVALAEFFSTAMKGRCKERPELAETPIPLSIRIPVIRSRSGPDAFDAMFGPLGYEVEARSIPLDPQVPDWGGSLYFDLTLRATITVRDALRHLYVLLPALDSAKHYYLTEQDVQTLMAKGEGWLGTHPSREAIIRGYLGRAPSLARQAIEQMAQSEESLLPEGEAASSGSEAERPPRTKRLHELRHERVYEVVRDRRPKSVIDLGCGDGRLVQRLMELNGLERIAGMDVSILEVERAIRRLRLEDATPRLRERVHIFHGSLVYRDARTQGFEMCTLVEVIEHLDPGRLRALERNVFGFASPECVVVTTPNREYNEKYAIEDLRHDDHRFEWTRLEFEGWARGVADRFGYRVAIEGIGAPDEALGAPSQMAVFEK